MITFEKSMDPHSLHIMRGGCEIGFLQWHSDRPARIILRGAGEQLDHNELQICLDEFKEIRDRIERERGQRIRKCVLSRLTSEERKSIGF